MLLGEQGGGHQNGHLTATVDGDKGRAHGHFGLAEADVTAHQAVHRLGRQHVGAHGLDGGLLVRGFFEREAGAERGVIGFRVGKGIAFAGGTAGVDVQQLGSHVAHLLGGLALGFLPGFRAQAVQRRQLIIAAGVAGDQVQVGYGHIELGAFGVFQGQELGHLIVHFQGRQALITAHAVVDMHHGGAFAQLGEVLDHRIVIGVGAFFPAPALHHALTEQRAFGNQCQRRVVQQQAFIQRGDGDRQAMFAGHEVGPAVDCFRPQLQAFQQFEQHFAAPGRFGGKQHAAIKLFEETGQGRQWLVGLGFDGQVGQRLRREAFTAAAGVHVILAGNYPRPVFEAGEAVFNRQEQLGRG